MVLVRGGYTITARNCTFYNNRAGSGFAAGAIDGEEFNLENTLLVDNTGGRDQCQGVTAINSNGGNYAYPADVNCNLIHANDVVSTVDPGLTTPQDNGGGGKTLTLFAGSIAIDSGYNAVCAATDARGVARPQNGTCDVGAYEAQ